MAALNKQQQVQEILKCGRDPVYFIRNYTKIQHPIRGVIPFSTYPFQDDCVDAFEKHRFNIILKSRQLGLSTICAAYATWFAMFHKAKNILVIATKLKTAQNFIKKVKVMLNSVPPWLMLGSFVPTTTEIRFSNGSMIAAIPTSEDAGRSEALSLLIVDEAAIIKNFEEIWTGLYPTISTGGNAILLSTPYGVGGQFYKIWTQAEAGLNTFNPIKLPWNVHPEHDDAWFENESRGMGKREIAQEFLCDFNASGDTFLQPEELEYIRNCTKTPDKKEGPSHNVWIWTPPELGAKYIISADVARGDSNDFSAFHVISAHEGSVVAEYKGKLPPDKFADLLAEYGHRYNDGLICPEKNTFGYHTCTKLRDMGYPRLYYDKARGNVYDYIPNDPLNEVPGFDTQTKTRIQMLATLEEMLRKRTLKVCSTRLYGELQGFVWHGHKAQAGKDNNDDLVMSLGIGAYLLDALFGTGKDAGELNVALLQSMHIARRDAKSIPGAIPSSRELANPYMMSVNPYSVMRPVDMGTLPSSRFTRDLSWLMR